MIYVASPYSDPSEAIRKARCKAVCEYVGELFKDGQLAFSPISHTYLIATASGLDIGWDFWQDFDKAMIDRCNAMYVYMLPGFGCSKGVRAEMEYARKLKMNVNLVPVTVAHAQSCAIDKPLEGMPL